MFSDIGTGQKKIINTNYWRKFKLTLKKTLWLYLPRDGLQQLNAKRRKITVHGIGGGVGTKHSNMKLLGLYVIGTVKVTTI